MNFHQPLQQPTLGDADVAASIGRELHRQATEGPPEGREDAMRQYIELVGDLGGQTD